MNYAAHIQYLSDAPDFLQRIYSNASDAIGIDYSFSGVNIGLFAGKEARSIELEQSAPNEKLLEEAKEIAEKLLNKDCLHLVMGISECFSDTDKKIAIQNGQQAGFEEIHLLYESVAAAVGAYWDGENTVDGTFAACVFRGNSFGDSTSFGLSIIEIKDGVFYVKGLNGEQQKIDNHIVKETCLKTIRELDLKHLDEVLIVGRKDYVTHEKPLVKAVRKSFKPLFDGECKYTRGHENLVAKGLAIYGKYLKSNINILGGKICSE